MARGKTGLDQDRPSNLNNLTFKEVALAFYWLPNQLLQTQLLVTIQVYHPPQFSRPEVHMDLAGSSAQGFARPEQGAIWQGLHPEPLESDLSPSSFRLLAGSNSWLQNQDPCFLGAASCGPVFAPQRFPLVFSFLPSDHLQRVESLSGFESLWFLLLAQPSTSTWKNFSVFKDLCNYIGATWIIQITSLLKTCNLNSISKVPFAIENSILIGSRNQVMDTFGKAFCLQQEVLNISKEAN